MRPHEPDGLRCIYCSTPKPVNHTEFPNSSPNNDMVLTSLRPATILVATGQSDVLLALRGSAACYGEPPRHPESK